MAFQAASRGFLVRERIALRFHHFENNVDAVVRIQTWWRRVIQWQRYRKPLFFISMFHPRRVPYLFLFEKKNEGQWQKQREEETSGDGVIDMKHYERHIRKVVMVQAYIRRWLAVRAFDAIKTGHPALSTLRRFLHLLDIGQRDYDEEMKVLLPFFFFFFWGFFKVSLPVPMVFQICPIL